MAYQFDWVKSPLFIVILILNSFVGCIDENVESDQWTTCDNGNPVLKEKWNDGNVDCSDGSDEGIASQETWCLEENKLAFSGNETDAEKVVKEFLYKRSDGKTIEEDFGSLVRPLPAYRSFAEVNREAIGICDFEVKEV